MISIEKLNFNNMDIFRSLNNENLTTDYCDKNFLLYYDKEKFISRVLLKKYIKLFICDSSYIGYLWVEPYEKNTIKIWAIYVKDEYVDKLTREILDSNKENSIIYDGIDGEVKNIAMKNLGFSIYKKTILLYLKTDKIIHKVNTLEECSKSIRDKLKSITGVSYKNVYISIERFLEGFDENLRCQVQNNIFNDKDRRPLTVSDIEVDMLQDYYIPELCLFIKINGVAIGYGQVIYTRESYTIVNFGIVDKFRGEGLGKFFLLEIIDMCKECGINELSIKVEKNNAIAINLYRSLGFKEKAIINTWRR